MCVTRYKLHVISYTLHALSYKKYVTSHWKGGENMLKLRNFVAISLMVVMFVFGLASVVKAANPLLPSDLGIQYGEATGLGSKDVRVTVASIIRTAMGLLGIVAVVIILIGGFTWMTAGGNEEKTGEAKKWIFSGVIGLAIILAAYALATYVINSLVSATTSP